MFEEVFSNIDIHGRGTQGLLKPTATEEKAILEVMEAMLDFKYRKE